MKRAWNSKSPPEGKGDVHIRKNQQLEIRHFKPCFDCFVSYTQFHKSIPNFKTSTPKAEKTILESIYIFATISRGYLLKIQTSQIGQ